MNRRKVIIEKHSQYIAVVMFSILIVYLLNNSSCTVSVKETNI